MWWKSPNKNSFVWKNIYLLSTCTCENGKYLGSIIGDSVISYDEIAEVAKTVLTKTYPRKVARTKTVLTKTVSPKTVPKALTKKDNPENKIVFVFYLLFC